MKNELSISINDLLKNIDCEIINKNDNITIDYLSYDSRDIKKNTAFVCIKGFSFDTHDINIINDVITRGAVLIIIDEDIYISKINKNISIVKTDNTRKALSVISSNFFKNPTKDMTVIGITGTKGKTTTSFMIKHILENDNIKTGIIGTVGILYNNKYIKTDNTTPESYILQKYFYEMKKENIKTVVMEVSSQSLKLYRTYGIKFKYAVFTNISPDHIGKNEHSDFDDYFNSKLKIFDNCEICVLNEDIEQYDIIKKYCDNKNLKVITYSIKDVKQKMLTTDKNFCIEFKSKYINDNIIMSMAGKYNISNALCAIAVCKDMGVSEDIIKKSFFDIKVPGRMEIIEKNEDFTVLIDYAYNELGAKSLFETIKEYNPKRIVVVFGCGGNRDRNRRFGMGRVSANFADLSIITADNSRYEKTGDIINDILTEFTKYNNNYVVIEDRRSAIEYAIKNHKKGDVILVIGKGHEEYNEFMGIKSHFSDKEEIIKILNEK